jgi:hypothetical protein
MGFALAKSFLRLLAFGDILVADTAPYGFSFLAKYLPANVRNPAFISASG